MKIKKYFLGIFILLVSVDILINSQHFFYTLKDFFYWTTKIQIKQLIILLNYIVQSWILIILLFSKNKFIRIITYAFLFFTFSIFLTYFLINGYGFTIDEANIALSNLSFIDEAFNNFSSSFYLASSITIVFLFLMYFFTKDYHTKIKTATSLSLFSILIIIYILGGTTTLTATTRLFFVPYKVVFNVYNAWKISMYNGKKLPVELDYNKSKVDKIVYIVDESIVGDKLSLNGFNQNTTPFLKSIEKEIINYGIASSGANCSNTSNTILRTGINPKQLPDKKFESLKNPNIWAYAKTTGYYTVYIDGQNDTNKPQNYMNKFDFKTIDKYIQIKKEYPTIKPYNIDFKIIKVILEELKKHKKVFIYVNKLGAHFHYEDTYPPTQKKFVPTLAVNESPELDEKIKMLNSYYNAIRWSVDTWWKELYQQSKNYNVLFIYTSDHGQNLFDNDSKQTHCSKKPVINEANVPFFLLPIGKIKENIKNLSKSSLEHNLNHVSHFNIFPTILFLEGYNVKNKEKTVFDDLSKQKRFFYTGDLWGRFLLQKHDFDKRFK